MVPSDVLNFIIRWEFFSSEFFRLKTVFEPPQTLNNKTVFTTEFLVIINFRIILLTPPFYKNLIL